VSRAPLPNSGVTSVGETWTASWEGITPPSSLVLAHAPLPLGSLLLRHLASFGESLQVVPSRCCPRQLPDVISENLSLDAGPHTPAVHRVLAPVSSTMSSAFPMDRSGRLPAFILRTTSRRASFRGCRYFVMFRPPSLLAPRIVPTAANTPQGSWGFYVWAYRASLPPHAPDMLTVRIQAIDGTGTLTPLDSQPCRLLPVLGCWIPFPGGTPCACACSFHGIIGLPPAKMGSASRAYPANDFSQGTVSRMQIFRNVPASKFAHPPGRSYRCEYSRRAAGASTSGPIVLCYLRTHRTC